MKDLTKDALSKEKAKDFWNNQSSGKKKGILIGAALIIVLAVVVTVFLNSGSKSGYKVLYPGLDASETSKVYAAIQEFGVQPEINSAGEITVPVADYDVLLLELAAKGYPKTTLPYNIFFDHSSLTSTEFEQKQTLIFQLQDRLQDTLQRMEGVSDAAVTITVQEESDYVWKQANEEKNGSTASVLLNLKSGVELLEDEVIAIKNLVSASTPKLLPENVRVVDAATRLELGATYSNDKGSAANSQSIKLEQQVQDQIEKNVVRLLSPRYGSNGVVAAAKVTLDFDAMIEERKDIQKQADGNEAVTEFDQQYSVNGQLPASGIVGEENNTDIPNYANNNPTAQNGMTNYQSNTKYDYGYIKTQIEKGAAVIKQSSISVMVNDQLTDAKRTELIDLISKSTNVEPANISLAPINPPAIDTPVEKPNEPGTEDNKDNMWLYFLLAGGAFLFILFIVIAIIIYRKRAKKMVTEIAAEKDEILESQTRNLQDEINQYKKQLEDAARASIDPKDDAITDEVRDFAKENPEITANLLRSWLKEEE